MNNDLQLLIAKIDRLADTVERVCRLMEHPVTDDEILLRVCQKIGTTPTLVRNKCRTKERHLLRMAVIEELETLGWGASRIGRALHREPSAISHALKKTSSNFLCASEPVLSQAEGTLRDAWGRGREANSVKI